MKACGISVYRITIPILFLACLVSLSSYYLQENILPYSNKKAEDVWSRINDRPPASFSTADRRWVMGRNRDRMYHYQYFDPIVTGFSKFSVFDFDPEAWTLKRLVYAEKAYLADNTFSLSEGWLRRLADNRPTAFVQRERFDIEVEESRGYFLRISKIPEQMSYNELRNYIRQIKEKDFEAVRFEVDLRSKISFPLASLVMVLLGIPFAFTMGKRGTLVGIGLSFVIAMIYWGMIAIFKSLGYVGYLSPFLAAWGPTFIFGAIGLYFILNVRT
jgi:LPS export ABC transporter permease LptG